MSGGEVAKMGRARSNADTAGGGISRVSIVFIASRPTREDSRITWEFGIVIGDLYRALNAGAS